MCGGITEQHVLKPEMHMHQDVADRPAVTTTGSYEVGILQSITDLE
jgi:hypothetical protein